MDNKLMDNMIKDTVSKIVDNYKNSEQLSLSKTANLPSRGEIIEIIKDLRKIMFPGYFADFNVNLNLASYFVGEELISIKEKMVRQINLAFNYENECFSKNNVCKDALLKKAKEVAMSFISSLPDIQSMLLKDVEAGFNGDPAAKSKEDIIFSYPGFFAIYVYRIAHELYKYNVPFIPRIMTEYAHSRTGIDINSGATIGEYFFIDHGTGVVIGETTIIGNNVKLYQGVTLGALSTRKGQQLRDVKRHPSIEDNVTIYSGATILGGDTVIGNNSVIGGNAFITSSIPPYTKVSAINPELKLRDDSKNASGDNLTWEI
ncbi:serine O-acetyltransferase [Lachnospiraceae bacterium RM5]|nr:serine O-acetyltransferase [Lachnospiraceae bacterium RM5]